VQVKKNSIKSNKLTKLSHKKRKHFTSFFYNAIFKIHPDEKFFFISHQTDFARHYLNVLSLLKLNILKLNRQDNTLYGTV
jgi:hypothetical protein